MNFHWPIDDTERIGTLQELRSSRMVEAVQTKEIDDWLKQSVALVEGCIVGLATNQRRIRYFGSETTHEQNSK